MNPGSDTIVVREFIQRELETINAYQAMLARTEMPEVRRMLAHAMEEEKEHVAEGMALLARLDAVQAAALATDHSPHFAEGGKGDLALRAFESGSSGRASPSAHADDHAPDPMSTARGFDVSSLTVGSLRGKVESTTGA